MTARAELGQVEISKADASRAFCQSFNALGNAEKTDIADILYVKPDIFEAGRTPEIAREIGELNAALLKEKRKYLLIGPGRWGSADRWLGIPVSWAEISGVGAMIETASEELRAEPSQGSHFFHNISTLGINYVTVANDDREFLDWDWIKSLPVASETPFVAHAVLERPFVLKVDGRTSRCVMFMPVNSS
jgi:hypothetical protein